MRLSAVTLHLALLGAAQARANADGDYDKICPSQADGQAHEISPGYYVEFKCDTLGPVNGNPISDVTSAMACAVECKAKEGCIGSSWVSFLQLCYLGGNSGSERKYSGTVYMKAVADPVGACRQEVDKLKDDLEKLKKDLDQCKAGPPKPVNYCDGRPNPIQVTEDGKKYRVYCGIVSNSGVTNDRVIGGIKSIQECVQKCNENDSFPCVQAIFNANSGTCYLRKAGEKEVPTAGASGWTSAQLVA